MFLLILLVGFVVFDLVVLRWGYDSRDDINSPEWKRRRGLTIWG